MHVPTDLPRRSVQDDRRFLRKELEKVAEDERSAASIVDALEYVA